MNLYLQLYHKSRESSDLARVTRLFKGARTLATSPWTIIIKLIIIKRNYYDIYLKLKVCLLLTLQTIRSVIDFSLVFQYLTKGRKKYPLSLIKFINYHIKNANLNNKKETKYT